MISILLFLQLINYTVFDDVQSQLPKGHDYNCSDPISSVHECTHGINAIASNSNKSPSFYVLRGKFFVLNESEITLKQVADAVPEQFRDERYPWYLVKAQKFWNQELRTWEDREGTFVFDELSALLNALRARIESKRKDRKSISPQVAEFIVYSVCVESDSKIKVFLQYQINRAVKMGVKFDPEATEFIKEKGYSLGRRDYF